MRGASGPGSQARGACASASGKITAAKANGQIGPPGAQRLAGTMQEDDVTDNERHFVPTETRKPMEADATVDAVPNQ